MSNIIKIKKGFTINLKGKAEKTIAESPQPETFALKPTDFHGITRPKLLVAEGDNVKAGSPLFYDKLLEGIMFCSPVSGEVVEIKRGAKRKILEVKILSDKKIEYLEYDKHSVSDVAKVTREDATELMKKSGVWPNIIQRPFGVIANPDDTPKSIFISSFDTHPLAPDYDFIFNGQENYFQVGVEVLKKFTSGKIHLGLNGNDEVSKVFAHTKEVEVYKISGKHPAGNVGTLIHHVDPVNKGDVVWTVNPFGVIQIGKLFLEGTYDASKIIALAGSEVKNPQYYKTYTGSSINKFVEGNLNSDHVRYISGNVLTGEKIASDGYIGFYDHQVSVIPEGDQYEMFGWVLPTFKKLSFYRALGLFSFLMPKKEYALSTNTNGEERAFVLSGMFEKVTPLDILPTYLIKAILAEDYDEMEELGIYEVIEEDLALCEFIDVSKNDIQKILREGIELIKNS